MDHFLDNIYLVTKYFPPSEIYGVTSQLKRAALSIPLNYQEDHGRFTDKSRIQFLRISFGSLRECQYLIKFSYRQHFINDQQYISLTKTSKEIYAMLWGILKRV